jgi:CMP-N,N'-diacetyllegionaminic acid synthase
MMITLGVIPARGGSKAIPLKNIRDLCGKPLLAYAIKEARRAASVSRLVVSTDHLEIGRIAVQYAAEVIWRPPELATDDSPTEAALIHVLDELKSREGFNPDVVLTLEPTSPFRTAETINRCVEILLTTDADSVIGVVETRNCYGRIIRGRFEYLFPGQPRRRQEREPLYRESSTIYGTRTETLRRKKSVLGDRLYPVVVPAEEAVDINTELDFRIAKALIVEKTGFPHSRE